MAETGPNKTTLVLNGRAKGATVKDRRVDASLGVLDSSGACAFMLVCLSRVEIQLGV